MAGGGDERTPASSSSSSSSRRRKPGARYGPGLLRSSERQNEGPSVSSKKSPLQMVTPVQPPKSVDLPPQMATPVQPPKSVYSQLQKLTPVQPSESVDSLHQLVASVQTSKYLDSTSTSCASGSTSSESGAAPFDICRGDSKCSVEVRLSLLDINREKRRAKELANSANAFQHLRPGMVLLKNFLKPDYQIVTPVQPSESLHSLHQLVASVQISKSVDSCASGTMGSESGAAPFDICRSDNKYSVVAKPSLLHINREKRRARELANSAYAFQHLRPGMVLLKSFLKPDDQVKIIKQCRELGVGTGRFYQPCYRNGAKLNLRMMCLGKNWDPDSCSYGDIRPFDGAQPPKIPEGLTKFVKDAIEASHAFLKQSDQGTFNPSKEIPPTSPDICIVNFYTPARKLCLHQDKDETQYSLTKRLPVVSFSLGDTAEFLYGDVRDEAKAAKIKLESGDVLIFGGQSRHIFHGVSSITPKTAPLWVTSEAKLRPGCLNLTFRQHNDSANITPAPFDICMRGNDALPLRHLKPGMVLLKKFLKGNDQVEIITLCQSLGVDTGGFHIPGLSLQTICLGKKLNPYLSSYGDIRPFDGAQPQGIPKKFKKLVEDAIEASHEFLERRGGTSNPLVELPPMSPDMCTVNVSTSIGRSGLCQDKDVTEISLTRELPVVCFSLGDTAEFLYGDARDHEASKIDIESGDVLIFGGQSRRIFHGVTIIKPKTAPEWLAHKTNLRAGRLNITFRQY